MPYNVLPHDIFYPPVQQTPPQMRCGGYNPEFDLLRRLGLAPMWMTPDGCCRRRMSKTTEPVSTKRGEKQTTVEKASLDFRGFSPEQLRVKVTDKYVIVRGEQRNWNTNVQVTKSVPLPEGTDWKNIVCRFENGHVTVHIPVTQQRLMEQSPERPSVKDEGREKQIDIDTKRKAEFERSVKTLGDLFSSLFGLELDESAATGRDEERDGKCEVDMTEGQKCEAEFEVKSKESFEENDRKGNSAALKGFETIDPVSSRPTPDGDDEQTLVMTVCGDRSNQSDEDGFVQVEKQEADEKVEPTIPGRQDDGISTLMTSLNVDVTEEDEQDDKSTDADEIDQKPEPTQPNDFKLEFDLSSYSPEQVRVVFRDDDVIIEAEREIKGDNYCETECLTRCIRVPDNVDKSMLKSYLGEKGLLTVQAPYKKCDKPVWREIKVILEE